jgi:hypothetical protein
MEKHLKLLAVLYIVYGSLHILAGIAGWAMIRWLGLFPHMVSGHMVGVMALTNIIAVVVLMFIFLIAVVSVLGGIGLLHAKRWSRIVVLVVSFLNLIHVPIGTALGAYGIWVLMNDETDRLFPQTPGPVAQQPGVVGQ